VAIMDGLQKPKIIFFSLFFISFSFFLVQFRNRRKRASTTCVGIGGREKGKGRRGRARSNHPSLHRLPFPGRRRAYHHHHRRFRSTNFSGGEDSLTNRSNRNPSSSRRRDPRGSKMSFLFGKRKTPAGKTPLLLPSNPERLTRVGICSDRSVLAAGSLLVCSLFAEGGSRFLICVGTSEVFVSVGSVSVGFLGPVRMRE
jgi:hypothetical protein